MQVLLRVVASTSDLQGWNKIGPVGSAMTSMSSKLAAASTLMGK